MKKGLRPGADGAAFARDGPKTSPDEKGIKTSLGCNLGLIASVQRPPLMKKGLRRGAIQIIAHIHRPKTSPDEKGIKTFPVAS